MAANVLGWTNCLACWQDLYCLRALQEVAETMGAPPVQPGQVEALKYVQELAGSSKLRFDFALQPGQPLLVAPHIVDSRKVED